VRDYLTYAAEQCIDCGLCSKVQAYEGLPEHSLRSLIIHKDQAHVYSCSLCGRCTAHCPRELDYPRAVRLLRAADPHPEWFSDYQVDGSDDFFRRTRREQANPLTEQPCGRRLFWPGCTLATFYPELVEKAVELLGGPALTLHCCGNPLESAGLRARLKDYRQKVLGQLEAYDELIVGCPNCMFALDQFVFASPRLTSLPQALLDAGIRYQGPQLKLTFHDSCPDRRRALFAKPLRQIFADCELVDLVHQGLDSRCCGLGGLCAVYDAKLAFSRTDQRLAEFTQSGAEQVLCACANCSNAFQQSQSALPVEHFLTLL
jgi:Fe-S oxidoreductase